MSVDLLAVGWLTAAVGGALIYYGSSDATLLVGLILLSVGLPMFTIGLTAVAVNLGMREAMARDRELAAAPTGARARATDGKP